MIVRGKMGCSSGSTKDPEPALGTSGSELSRERHGCSLLVEFGPGGLRAKGTTRFSVGDPGLYNTILIPGGLIS